jgi:hypothetical protein
MVTLSLSDYNTAPLAFDYTDNDQYVDCFEFSSLLEDRATLHNVRRIDEPESQDLLLKIIEHNVNDAALKEIMGHDTTLHMNAIEDYIYKHAPEAKETSLFCTLMPGSMSDDGKLDHTELDTFLHLLAFQAAGTANHTVPGHVRCAHVRYSDLSKVWSSDFGAKRDAAAARKADLKARLDAVPADQKPASTLIVRSNCASTFDAQFLLALTEKAKDPAQYNAFTLQTNPAVLSALNPSLAGLKTLPTDVLSHLVSMDTAKRTADATLARLEHYKAPEARLAKARTEKASADAAYSDALTAFKALPKINVPAKTELMFGLR